MLKLPLPRLRKGLEMKGNLRKDTLTETYIDIEGYILAATWKFWNLYGGDIEDLKGQASLIFIRAFDNYNPDKGAKLESWVTFKILKGLIDYMKKGNGYKPHIQIDDVFVGTYPASNENFSVMELLDEMKQDAHIVLRLFFEIPNDIMVNILNKKKRTDHTQAAVRNHLQNRLRQLGWSMKRIRKTFEEIKEVTGY